VVESRIDRLRVAGEEAPPSKFNEISGQIGLDMALLRSYSLASSFDLSKLSSRARCWQEKATRAVPATSRSTRVGARQRERIRSARARARNRCDGPSESEKFTRVFICIDIA